jgi:hypothetical protein
MIPNKTYELRNLYWQQSQYTTKPEEKKYDPMPLLQWPANGYFEKLKPDADLLQQAITPFINDKTNRIAERVFGNELNQQNIDLKHTENLFYERCKLHQQHIRDIDERHLTVQERLFGVEINHFPDRNKQLRTLEGQLMQLEQQRREEELAFWKDTVDLRKELFASAADYRDTKHRYDIFSSVEEKDGRE